MLLFESVIEILIHRMTPRLKLNLKKKLNSRPKFVGILAIFDIMMLEECLTHN